MASFGAVWAAIAFDSSKLGAHLCVDHIKNGMVMPLVLIMKILDDFDRSWTSLFGLLSHLMGGSPIALPDLYAVL